MMAARGAAAAEEVVWMVAASDSEAWARVEAKVGQQAEARTAVAARGAAAAEEVVWVAALVSEVDSEAWARVEAKVGQQAEAARSAKMREMAITA